MRYKQAAYAVGLGYIASIVLGNVFIALFGIFNVWGLPVPAGAVWIGLTFSLRDLTQKFWGTHKVWYFMFASAVVSAVMSPSVAFACFLSFLVSEALDWLVFTISRKSLRWRLICSNLVSTPVDSAIFITLVFGFNPYIILVQALVKYISGLLVLPALPYFEKWYNRLHVEHISDLNTYRRK